jgi:hypothetical protein
VESGEAVRWPVGEYAGESWPRCALGLESERGQEAERSCRLQRQAGRGAEVGGEVVRAECGVGVQLVCV